MGNSKDLDRYWTTWTEKAEFGHTAWGHELECDLLCLKRRPVTLSDTKDAAHEKTKRAPALGALCLPEVGDVYRLIMS